MSTSPAPQRSLLRRLRFPIIVLAVPALLILVESLWNRFEWNPELLMYLGMAMSFSIMLAPLLLLIWFVFFSSFTRQTRLLGVLLIVLLGGAAYAAIRKVEFDGRMKPIVYYRWEKMPQDQLETLAALKNEPVDVTIGSTDSPLFRGPNQDGTTPGAPTGTEWARGKIEILWKHALGGGHAGIAVAGQAAITIEQRGDQEAVVAYHTETGKPRWVVQYPAAFEHSEPMGGNGPRTTPVLVEGLVYTLGAQGHLHCIEAATGLSKWVVNVLHDAQAKNLEWGMSGSPLIVGDTLYVNPGIHPDKNSHQAVAAYDRMTGKKRWGNGSDQAGYATMMHVKLAGVPQLLLFDAAGLKGLDPRDGKQLWLYPWKTSFEMNCAQPVVVGDDQVFLSSEVANGGAMVKLSHEGDAWKVSEIWKNRYLGIKFSNAVLHNGHLYGISNGYLTCLDARTGERKWKARQSYGNGQVLLAGEVLVITTEDGALALCATDTAKFTELNRLPVFAGRTWNIPAIARGRLYLRNHQEIACVKLW